MSSRCLFVFFIAMFFLTSVMNKALAGATGNENQTIKKEPHTENGNTTAKQYDAWWFQCGRNEKRCFIQQNILTPKSKKIFVGISVGYRGTSKNPRLLFKLPLGIMLPPGVSFDIDNGQKTRLPLEICTAEGCKADVALDKKLVARMRLGKQMNVFFISGGTQKTVKVEVSLQGFNGAYAELAAKQK